MNGWTTRLFKYAIPFWRGISGLLAVVLVGVGLQVLQPWPVKWAVDLILKDSNEGSTWLDSVSGSVSPTALLIWLAVSFVFIAVLRRTILLLQAWIKAWLGARLVYALGSDVFARLMECSRSWYDRQRIGDLVRRVNADSTCIRDLVMGVALPVTQSLLTLTAIFVIMWQLDWIMALVALLVAIPMGGAIRIFAGPMAERSYQQAERSGELSAIAEQSLGVIPVVQAFQREDHEHHRFRHAGENTVRATLRALASQLHFRIGVNTASAMGTAAILLIGGHRALAGQISVGDLYVFLSYLAALYAPLESLAYLASGIADAKGKARRVLELFDTENALTDPVSPRKLPPLSTHSARGITFERVDFEYTPGFPVLKDISLSISPGESVALVGTTGAGKSTLVSLIPRFSDPTRGSVHLDGVDLRELQRASVRSQVAWLPQDPTLLPISIADNIAFGRPEAPRDQIIAAAKAAGAHDFISRLPEEYETIIGERGATLSGGEAQRLAIARALLKDAPIVILDEPTASLDAATEASVMEAIKNLTQDRTTLLIAHRLSTIRRANRIIVLSQGRIIESGTHQQLCQQAGTYARHHVQQSGLAGIDK